LNFELKVEKFSALPMSVSFNLKFSFSIFPFPCYQYAPDDAGEQQRT
jgi:hypothetical protein